MPFAAALILGGTAMAVAQAPGNPGNTGGSSEMGRSGSMNSGSMNSGGSMGGSTMGTPSSGARASGETDANKTDATGSINRGKGPNKSTGGNPGGDDGAK